jgi:hypothetical protein
VAAIGALGALLLGGCAGAALPAPSATATVVADKTAPPAPVVPEAWPLTGVAGDVIARPAVAVKIENTAEARPQTGLEGADVVWEEIVEFGVSRLVAVYHSTLPREVGPIRSVRPADAAIASPLRGLFAFSGGQEAILDLMAGTPLQLLSHDDGDDGFYRVRTRRAPHNVYGSLTDFLAQADAAHQDQPGEQFTFARRPGGATAQRLGSPAPTIDLELAPGVSPSWTWDGGAERWLRSEAAGPSFTAAGERLSVTNVVVVVVESFDSGLDAQLGEPVPDLRLVGSGRGLLASGGKAIEVTWSKAERAAPLVLTAPDGTVATLGPGTTWVELVPLGEGSFEIG